MKTLKITLVALFSIGLLTAVLPSSETEPTVERSNHEVKNTNTDLAAMIDPKHRTKPSNG